MRWVLVLLVLVALLTSVDAKFAESQGFSGKHGVTCGTCHSQVAGDPTDPAQVQLLGLPVTWEPNATYALTIRVFGGPPPNPVPGQPQGGFDIEIDAGRLTAPANMSGLVRNVGPLELTYTGQGTARRAWSLLWTVPNLTGPPTSVHFWLAGLAANGNHIMNGPDSSGERGDRFATLERIVPPSAAAQRAWDEQPLAPPRLDPLPASLDGREKPVLLTGVVPEFADGAEWNLDGSEWRSAIGVPSFVIQLPALEPGPHTLGLETRWNQRTSDPAFVALLVPPDDASPGTLDASGGPPLWAWILAPVLVGLLLAPLVLKLIR